MTNLKCKNCGADIHPNMKFCGVCGTPAEYPEAKEPAAAASAAGYQAAAPAAKKGISTAAKLMMIIVPVIIIVVVVAAGILFTSLKPSKYVQSSWLYIYNEEEEVAIMPKDAPEPTIKLEGYMYDYSMSMDGTAAAVLIYNEGSIGYSLYYVNNKATFIADEVYEAVIAASGKSVAFSKVRENESLTTELCIWSDGKITTITDDCSAYCPIAVSPDGKTVAYTVNDEDADEDEEGYIGYYYNGKEIEIGEDIQPFAVADGAKHIYYQKDSSSYVQKGTDSDSRNKLGEDIYDFFYNRDLTSVIYNNGSKSYISRNGGSKEGLSGLFEGLLLPQGVEEFTDDYYYSRIYDISDFTDTFYMTSEDSVIHINGKYETNRVASNVDRAQLVQDGKTIIYQKGDSIYKVNGMKEDAEDVELVEEDVQDFIATSDGKAVFFYNTDDELMYQKGTGKPIHVADDLEYLLYSEDDHIWAMFDGNKLFYVSDEELCWTTGGKGTAVDIEGENFYVMVEGNRLLIVSYYEEDYYYGYSTLDGENFELILESSDY